MFGKTMRLAGLLVSLAMMSLAQGQTAVGYTEDFQAYGTPSNPPGWVDTSVGNPKPTAGGLYKTWSDPLQGNHGPNIVYGTKQSSGKPEGNNPRIGTFSTLTAKTFTAKGHFELRGRMIRTTADARIGLTVLSSYPEQDKYYLLGLWSKPGNAARLTMQLFAFGAGTPAGTLDSDVSLDVNKWYQFSIQLDDANNATRIQARFWPDGTTEPTTFSIDANDSTAARLITGRIGMWGAVRGDAYIDDLNAKSSGDNTAPVITFVDADTQRVLDPAPALALFKTPARIDIRVTDDSPNPTYTAKLDTNTTYVSGTAITADGQHDIKVHAVDATGNFADATLKLLVDQQPPVIALQIDGLPFAAGAIFNKDVTLSAVVTDISQVTKVSELDGNIVTLPLLVADEKLHQIKVTATDQVGWESSATSNFIVDKTPPVIEIKANGAVMNGGESFIADPTLSWTATDLTLDQVSATLDGNAFTSGSVVSVDGVHTLAVTATDRAGHTKTETRSFALDKTAPEVHLLANNASFVAGTTFNAPVTFTADIRSATPTTKNATIDDQPYTLGTAYGVEGVHSIKLIVTNAAGLPTTVGPFPFTVDLTKPVVTLTESGEPFHDGMKFARDVNPVVTATDNLTATPERTLLVDGNPYPLDTPISEEQIDHTISASAKDAGGNTATVGPFHFLLDKTKPVVTIVEATSGHAFAADALFNRPVTVKITVTDLTHTTLVATVDGAPLAIGPDGTSAPISGDGSHTVSAIATDEVGNSNDAVTASFTIDTTAPHLTFTSHHDGDVLTTPFATFAGGSDDALSVSVNEVPAIVDTDAKTFSGATLSLVEGTNTITARGIDKAGNPGSASIDVILDTRAPEIVIAQPAADACLDATTLTVSGTASDPRIASVTVNGTATTLDALHGTWTASIAVSEGRQLLTVVATDSLGHSSTVTRNVVIDRTAPVIDVRESGAPFTATLLNRAITLVVSAGSDTVSAKLDNVAYVNGATIGEGAHALVVSATDCAGHQTDRTLNFAIDLTPPTIRNLNPANGSTAGTTPTAISGTTDTDAARVDILGSTRSAIPNADGTFTIAGVPFADGVNRFTLQATDKAGNTSTLDYAVTVKTAAPVVTILESGSPLVAGTLFNRSIAPEVRSSDATATITATLNSAPFTSGTAVTADGNYTLSATATDALHHSGHADTTFVIDRTPPVVRITSPATGVVTADHVEVRGTAGDAISASVNGIPVTLAADGTFVLPSLPLEFGTTPIVATGRDRAGNTGHDQVNVTLADARPGIILTYPPDHSLTNRTATEVLGRVLSQPADHQVTIGAQTVPVDPSGAFRLSGYALVEGENTITASVKTGSNATNSATVHVTGDFTPPSLTINESGQPLAEDARFATQAVLTLAASDNSGNVIAELTLDGTKVVTLPVTVTTNGGHSASAIARDAAGNESRADRTFFIGTTTGGGNSAGCALSDFDPADKAVILTNSTTLVGRSGGALGVKVNGVAASVADGSFRATVELPNEGANAVTIVCTDGNGNPTGTPVTITLNRITGAPSISIDAPAEGFITGSETITVTGSVGPGVTKADVNGAAATITGDDLGVSRPFSAANVRLAAGLNVLVAHGKNDAGRIASASRRVFLLKDAPAISISSPIPGISTGSASIAVSGTWTNLDPATIVVANVTSGVVVPSPGLAASDTTGTFNLPSIALVPGEQTLKVTGRDRIDREATATVNVKLLAGTPSVVITQPLDHAYFGPAGGDTFAVSGTFQGAAGSTVDVNGSAATLSGASYNATIPFATGAGGITPVIARVTEPSGASAIASIVVTKLSAAPKVIESFPAPNAVEVDPGALLLVLFSAPMDRASLVSGFRLEDASGATVTGTLYLDKDVITFAPAALLVRGASYTIRVTVAAKDVAGTALAAEYTAPFTVGTTAPSTAPTITPVANAFCGQLVTIKGTAPAGARLRLDSGTVSIPGTADAQGNFTISFPLSGQSGYATVRVRIVGSDGSFSPAAEITFRIDCAGPQVLNATYDRGGANRIAIVFSEAIDPATTTGAISLTLSDGNVVTGNSVTNGSNVTVTPAQDLSAKSFTLNVTTAIKDVIGNKLVTPFTQSFDIGGGQPQAGDGTGFITGEIYDATTGRPLPGASINVEVPTTAFARIALNSSTAQRLNSSTQSVTTTSDARGRYLVRLPEGAHTIKATMNGYTTVWRQIIVTAGAGVIPIDIRLTRIGAAGGETSITRKVTLTGGGSATLTAVGGQALTGLLPLGWSPLASAVVVADAPLNGATLKFTVPATDIAAASQNLSAVRYDELRDTWLVLVPVVNILTDGTASIPIDGAGSFALVYPDKAPGLAQPALATAGAPLQGVAAPVTEPVLTPRGPLHLNPPVVLPNGRTAATLNIEGLGGATFPSGTAVQAYIDEELKLADGSSLLDPPFATDLLLYRALNGETGVSDFHLAPSPRAAQVILEIGFDHIRVVPYPGRLDRGTLVGSEGGRVPADDKVAIELPTGATPEPLRATAASLAQADLDAVGTIPGFRILGGFNISLQRATEPAPQDLDGDGKPDAVAPVELFKTARATFTIDPSKLPTPSSQLILAELLADTPYGKLVRIAAQLTAIDSTRYTTRAIDRGLLPLDGIIREGRYLLLAAEVPLAYATGSVHLGIGGSLLANARVSANALGVADLTRVDGIYNIPVAAVPAGPFTLTPRHTATGDGAVYTHASGVAAESINKVDLNLVPQPPALTAVTVIAFDASQHALSESTTVPNIALNTNVRAAFSPAIDPASITDNSIIVTDAQTGETVSGKATGDATGITWTLTAGQRLKNDNRYSVTVASSIRGTNGSLLGRTITYSFTTVAALTSTEVHAERVGITIPDANGFSRVFGTAGALPTGWQAVVVRRNIDFITRYQATAAADGSFTFIAGNGPDVIDRIKLSDSIDLYAVNTAGALAAIIPLTPFVTEDHRGFVAPATSDVRFTSADGIVVTVSAGTFDQPTIINVIPTTHAAVADVPHLDEEVEYATSVRLDYDGVAHKPMELELPVPAGFATSGKNFILGYRGDSVRGPRIMAVDTLRIVDGKFSTTEDPNASSLRAAVLNSNARVASQTVLTGKDIKKFLMRVQRSGVYMALDIRVPVGLGVGWAVMDGFQRGYDLFWDTLLTFYAADFYLFEKQGRVVVPVITGKQFTVVGVDATTGLKAFSRVYDPIPIGDPNVAVTIPSPEDNTNGPYPIFGIPFRAEIADVNAEEVDIEEIRNFTIRLEKERITVKAGDDPLPPETKVEVLDITNGKFISGNAGQSLTLEGKMGDRIALLIEQKDVDPTSALGVTFSEPIYVNGKEEDAIAAFLKTQLKLELADEPAANTAPVYTDITEQGRYTLDSGGRRLAIELPSSLQREAIYRLTLKKDIADRSGPDGTAGLKLGQGSTRNEENVVTPAGGGNDLQLVFHTRKPGGKLATFDIASGLVRDLAINGNVLLVTTTSIADGSGAALYAYDIADPASLNTANGGTAPKPIAKVQSSFNSSLWAVASDPHGRIYVTEQGPVLGSVHSYRLEDLLKATDSTPVKQKSGAVTNWTLGYSSSLPLGTTLLSDRPESIPRKLQILLQDEDKTYDGREDFKNKAGATEAGSYANGIKKYSLAVPVESDKEKYPYLIQRVTVENVSLDMRWSVDVTQGSPATITNIIAGANDRIKVTRNLRTYGVISHMGYGIGVYDLNAIESNDVPNPPSGYKTLAEQIVLTPGANDPACFQPNTSTPKPPDYAIPDLTLSAEAAIRPGVATPSELRVFAPDPLRGLLDLRISLDKSSNNPDPLVRPEVCDQRSPIGLILRSQNPDDGNPRLAALATAFQSAAGREPFSHFISISPYTWRREAQDNAAGVRGSIKNAAVTRDYLLLAGGDLGVIVIETAGSPRPNIPSYPPYWPLKQEHVVDVIWVPGGAVAVRTIPRTNMAVIVDRAGRVLIADLSRLDERFDENGKLIPGTPLFATVARCLSEPATGNDGGVGAYDPRIIWKSEKGIVTGTLPPVVDGDTGMVYAGELMKKALKVVAALDPRIEMKVDIGEETGLSEVGGVVPLGIAPPANVAGKIDKLPPCSDGNTTRCKENASLGTFRLELTLPGAIVDSLTKSNKQLQLAVESERVFDAPSDQTPAGFPRSHLRRFRRDGSAEDQTRAATNFKMQRVVPDDPALEKELRHQRGFNKFVSPWIVALADPRASAKYQWGNATADQKKDAGCESCARPKYLEGKTEDDGVYELWTNGRIIAVRPEWVASNGTATDPASIFADTPYEYLGDHDRLVTRFATIMADTVRPIDVRIAAQNPPAADGELQEMTMLHSGEMISRAVDLVPGGRANSGVVLNRSYHSRTIGGTFLGQGWESSVFQRIRPLPNGDIELRDASGEIWLFKQKTQADNVGRYESPKGFFAKITRADDGWRMLDQKWRVTTFDELGRITSETDEFYKADTQAATEAGIDNGNIIRYLYDESGRLARIVDPVHRATTLEYWNDSESQEPGAYPGLLKEIKDWRERTVEYLYDKNGQLKTVKMPEAKAGESVPSTYEFTDTRRPRVEYTYKEFTAPQAGATPDQGFNDFLELQNLATIKDPAEALSNGDVRVTFSYDESADPQHHDREKRQIWATGEFATFTYNGPTSVESVDVFGQKRTYTLTGKDDHDKRIHVQKKTLDAVPVVEFPSGLPPKADLNVTAGSKNLETSYEFNDEGLHEVEHYPNGLTVTNTWRQIVNSGPGKVLIGTLYEGTNLGQENSAFGYDKDTAAGNLLTITKSNADGSVQRDHQVPSRERLTVESKDEDLGHKQEYDTNGLLKKDSTTSQNGAVALEHSLHYYAADATLLIARSQVFSESQGNDALRQNYVYSNTSLGGYRLHTTDVIHGTTTDTDYDAYDRVVHVVTRDGNAGTVLADATTGYDASGRIAYLSRKQKDAGNVITTITYDEIGRETKRTLTGAAVNGSPSTLQTTTRYDIPGLKVTRTDPAVGTEGGTEITDLDHLGRPTKRTHIGGSSLTQFYGYDSASAGTYISDGTRVATLQQRDELHREMASVGADGVRSKSTYDAWGRLVDSSTSDSGGNVIAHSGLRYSANGRVKRINEQVDADGRSRQRRFGWDTSGLTLTARVGEATGFQETAFTSGKVRAQQTTSDAAGRVQETLTGEATGTDGAIDASSAFSRTTYGYQGFAPNVITQYEPLAAGARSTTITMFDGLGRPLELAQSGGSSSTKNQYDEAGNVVSHTAPGMKQESATYDSRGLVTRHTLPDGRTQEFQYDETGSLTSRKDESGETTIYTNDDLGRLTKVQYADGTTEEKQYEFGSGFLTATKDRAGQWLSREYDDKGRLIVLHNGQAGGPPLMTYEYDAGGRLTAIRNADGAIEFAELDLLGRPKITRSIRYANHSGLSDKTIADVHSQRHSWSVFNGERSAYRLPDAGATPQGFDSLVSPWMQTIAEERDAGGNVVRQTENSDPIAEAVSRGIGRIQLRRQFVGSKSLDTSYGFADGGTVASGVQLPAGSTANLQSFLLRWTQSKIGDMVVGGSANNRDSADRVSHTREQGLGDRVSEFHYDDLGRLTTSWLKVPGPVATTVSQGDSYADADFRSARLTSPQLSAADRAKLGTVAAEIEPPSWTATHTATEQIGSRTLLLGDSSSVTRNYAFTGARRTNDGKWTSSFDAFGHLSSISSVDAGRRVDYLWDPSGRLIGRTAFRLDGTNNWVPEDRGEVITRDGIPADTTFVWDPVSDRLLAIYEAGKSVSGTGGTTAGLVRQYLHGDQGYDDPLRVVMPGANGTVTYLPIVDQAGGGSLQAVIDNAGTMVERVLYADSYGDAPRYLQGPIVDRISFAAKKDGNGDLQNVDVKVHFTEAIESSTVSGGVRLAAVDAAKTVVYETGVSAATDDKYSVHWSLTKTEWEHFTTATNGASLEIAIGNTLRASAWGDATVTAAPHWTRTIYGTDSTSQFPVITRQSLASVVTFISGVPANEEKSTDFYSINSLYLAGTEESKAKLLFDFHALPFRDPATHLVYARARWYDPSTGTFLTPDDLGFIDSSNLYAFGAADPVNRRDPSGNCAGVDSVDCGDYATGLFDQFNNPLNWWGNTKRSGRFLAFEGKGYVMAAPRAAKGVWESAKGLWNVLRDPVGARMRFEESAVNFAVAVAMDPGEFASNMVNDAMNANPDSVAEGVGDALFWFTLEKLPEVEGIVRRPQLNGAGRAWKTIGEVHDPSVVKQRTGEHCGQACAQMLFEGRGEVVLQEELKEGLTSPQSLSRDMNNQGKSQWFGEHLGETPEALSERGPWAASILPPKFNPRVGNVGHWVIVDGFDKETGHLLIRDPWDQTRYRVTREEFMDWWNKGAIIPIQ